MRPGATGACRFARFAAVAAFWAAAGTARGDGVPLSLTAWRTPQGIFLSWSAAGKPSVGVWRGAEPGALKVLAVLPAGQSGFLDLAAQKNQEYVYALGDDRRPQAGAEVRVSAVPAAARVLASLLTTCSGLSSRSPFPADARNYFFPSRDAYVNYFGYFLVRPFDPSPRTARVVWRDPAGAVFCEYEHPYTPRPVQVGGESVGHMLLTMYVGLKTSIVQNGQKRVASEPGMYTIETFVDGDPVGLSIYYVREEGAGSPAR